MDNFIKLVEILAWPVTSLILIFAMRKPITGLIPQISKFKYKELEMEFEKDLNDLSQRSQETKLNNETEIDQEEDYYLQKVKDISPRAAILESWLGLESTAISSAKHFNLISDGKRQTLSQILKLFEKEDILTSENVEIINDLRMLRNKATHETNFHISEEEATKFMEIARDQAEIIASEAWQKFGGCNH